jgi:hypothetical protein
VSDSTARNLLDALGNSFAASLRAPDGVAVPAALLWTDGDSQWKPLIPAMKQAVRQLFELGAYAPDIRRGPVIWLKCIVDRTLPEAFADADVSPILYLPGVSRQDLRAGGDCARELLPLIELQHRGAIWHQRNGRDWSVEAYLTSDAGLGLDIAQDQHTRESMLRSLSLLATEPAAGLRGRRLEAEDFDRLAFGDSTRDLLVWMSEPDAFEQRCDRDRWATFRDVCLRDFKFDPDSGGSQAAADGLLNGGGKWDDVWQRFCDAPRLYFGIPALLREARPDDLFTYVDASRRPGVNEEREDRLSRDLESLPSLPHAAACDRIIALDAEHGERRGWVWAQLGKSPFASALEPLTRLARSATTSIGGASVETMAADYAAEGWRCDRAALDAIGHLRQGKEAALITRVVRAVYEPWLDRSARRFQEVMAAPGVDPASFVSGVLAERDTCILFVDGLRFDLGVLLKEKLEGRGYRVELLHRMSPVPTVTATAKPLATPSHSACSGNVAANDFAPTIAPSGLPAGAARLRDAMAREGIDVLGPDDVRIATGSPGGGWTEIGAIDTLGHQIGALLVHQIEPEIDAIADRISELLESGWLRVRAVTDHGWVLLPGGLPRVDLPPYLVETKWVRCAAVRGASSPEVPTYPWYWNSLAKIASPPGISAFRAGEEYAHGGVSLQECVTPELIVERGADAISAKITSVSWRGMRCRVATETNVSGLLIDLRLNWKMRASSLIGSTKEVAANGEASFAVSNDEHEGAAASVVLIDSSGHVLDYKPTTIGERA